MSLPSRPAAPALPGSTFAAEFIQRYGIAREHGSKDHNQTTSNGNPCGHLTIGVATRSCRGLRNFEASFNAIKPGVMARQHRIDVLNILMGRQPYECGSH